MKQNKKSGFTLIELIVVLAILAILAAVAVPQAFGALEKARDQAAHASVRSIASVARMGISASQLDEALVASIGQAAKSTVMLTGTNGGKFELASENTENTLMHQFLLKHFNDSAVQMDPEAAVKVEMGFSGGRPSITYIFYYPKGLGISPYYAYDTSKDEIVKC